MSTYKAWHYAAGMWCEEVDPLTVAWAASDWDGGEEEILRKLGYQMLFKVGERGPGAAFEVWRRDDSPRHVFVADMDELLQFLYVDAYPDVLVLAAQWATLVRDARIVEFLDDLDKDEEFIGRRRYGLVETIARRARYGWSH